MCLLHVIASYLLLFCPKLHSSDEISVSVVQTTANRCRLAETCDNEQLGRRGTTHNCCHKRYVGGDPMYAQSPY